MHFNKVYCRRTATPILVNHRFLFLIFYNKYALCVHIAFGLILDNTRNLW